jgi:hypothetical protein
MLYVPATWFAKCVDSCRTVAVEVVMDVRGLLQPPFHAALIATNASLQRIHSELTSPALVKNARCPELARHFEPEQRLRQRQRVAVAASVVLALLAVALVGYAWLSWTVVRGKAKPE